MERRIPKLCLFILAALVLANMVIAPAIYNPRFVAWQPGVFETGILNLDDDAVGGRDQKMVNIPPPDAVFNETKGQSKGGVAFSFVPVAVLNIDLTSPVSPLILIQHSYISPLQTHTLQTRLCTFLI